jgi:3-oxoacyl-(acyl-carrier-protein) synthase
MGFYKLGALSNHAGNAEDACKPFDKDRKGLVIGEGGIAILLETEATAQKDRILAEIVGYASSLDSYQITDPVPTGEFLAKAALQAIAEAGISPADIDCVHMHETGTVKNALAESAAMKLIFGERLSEIPVYSMKGQVGHLIGACGAIEMIGVVYSILNQKVPHTVNFVTPDPEVPLRVVQNKALDWKINYVLKLNAAFGGQNTALVIKKY